VRRGKKGVSGGSNGSHGKSKGTRGSLPAGRKRGKNTLATGRKRPDSATCLKRKGLKAREELGLGYTPTQRDKGY